MGNTMTPTTCDMFDAYNVDARLFKQSKGQLQISASSLTFEIKSLFTNKNNSQSPSEPIIWPLTGIRRYGYHKNIFLFECGRRCPNGEGLYAFMTNKARRLNDSVHKAIINSTTQPCNLQPSISREANRNGKKLLTKINSILTTDTILTTDAESMNYTCLNDGSSSNYIGTTATERTTSYEDNTMTDNTIYYRMLGACNQSPSGLQEHPTEARSSYYVNDDIVRLPVNLNFLNSNDTEYNNYVNSDLIDPRILAITKKFTKNLSEHKADNRAGQATSTSDYYVPTLNYIVPEKMIKPTTGTTMDEEGDGEVNYVKQGRLEMITDRAKVTNARLGGTKQKAEAINYVVIDKDKTPAAQFSQKQVDSKRSEYFRFPKH